MSLKKLGRYDLIRVLGRGAMGVVYEGRDPNLDRRVAIKTVKVENLSEEAANEYEARFRTEARSAARLQHPNIVSVYDSDRDLDIAYLVMEYIQGEDLKHHLDKGIRYSLEKSLKMVRDLLSALDYAHKQGIVHRDVKPANLLIEPGGRVKLTDFGVARIQDSGEATRTQGNMVGTLKYMSPEQVQGQKIDSRADLFSVGVVLYQLLTDKRPFDGDNDFSIIHQIIGHTPAPPSTFNARLPSAIDAVVARALAKDREHRFATARDFASALQSAMRRAEDQTVVPPADPFKKTDGAGSGSKAALSLPGGGPSVAGGSSVTQEVELVYWKDIKDSTDPEELEGFLDRFPAGIYADLARRRLRKLSSGNSTPDQTVLSGGSAPGARPDDVDATRVRTGTAPLLVREPAEALPARVPEAAHDAAEDPTSPTLAPIAESSRGTGTAPLAAVPGVGLATQPAELAPQEDYAESVTLRMDKATLMPPESLPEREPDEKTIARADVAAALKPLWTAPVKPAAPPKRRSLGILAALGGVAVVGIAAFLMLGRSPEETVAAPAPAASSPQPEIPVAPPVVLTTAAPPVAAGTADVAASPGSLVGGAGAASPAVAAAPMAPQQVTTAPALKASAVRRPASAAKAKPAASAPPPVEIVRPAPPPPAPVPVRDEPRPAPVRMAPAPPNPVEACKDKVFLSKEFCLAEHCDNAGSRNHPLCVKRREEIKLREESRIRN